MRQADFEKTVQDAIEELPLEFREKLDNVAVMIAETPSPEQKGRTGTGDTLLGLYEGIPLPKRGSGYGGGFYSMALPDRITLFQRNIENYCRYTGKSLIGEIKRTIFHEIGHYMGLDEGELEDLERKHLS